MRTGRRFASLAVAVLTALSSACGNSNPTTATSPSPSPGANTTETFSGTLLPRTSTWHAFTASTPGTLNLTVTTLAPTSTQIVGIGVGTSPTNGCAVQVWNNTATTGTILSSPVNPGGYCVAIYDAGNVTDSVNYTLTLDHP